MGLHFSTDDIFIRTVKLGVTKNTKKDPVKMEPIIGRFVSQDCQHGDTSRSWERCRTDLPLWLPEGTSPVNTFTSDVTRDSENISVVFRHLGWCFLMQTSGKETNMTSLEV